MAFTPSPWPSPRAYPGRGDQPSSPRRGEDIGEGAAMAFTPLTLALSPPARGEGINPPRPDGERMQERGLRRRARHPHSNRRADQRAPRP